MRLRVVCGLGVTIETLRPTSVLTSVDLPALGRPTMATNPDLNGISRQLYADASCCGELEFGGRMRPKSQRGGQNRLRDTRSLDFHFSVYRLEFPWRAPAPSSACEPRRTVV